MVRYNPLRAILALSHTSSLNANISDWRCTLLTYVHLRLEVRLSISVIALVLTRITLNSK